MKKEYVIDLSQRLQPGKEHNFNFELDLRNAVESMSNLAYDEDVWYKIAYVSMCTHNGTHIEVPFHHIKTGLPVADFPLAQLIGRLVLLDFSYKKEDEVITEQDIRAYDDKIKEGDIVFMKTHMDKYFRSADWCTYPYVELEGVKYLISKKIGVLGTDAAGIEDPDAFNQPGHVTLLSANIPLVESLTNLDAIDPEKTYMVFILPVAIENGDAFPVRITAVAKEAFEEFLADC